MYFMHSRSTNFLNNAHYSEQNTDRVFFHYHRCSGVYGSSNNLVVAINEDHDIIALLSHTAPTVLLTTVFYYFIRYVNCTSCVGTLWCYLSLKLVARSSSSAVNKIQIHEIYVTYGSRIC